MPSKEQSTSYRKIIQIASRTRFASPPSRWADTDEVALPKSAPVLDTGRHQSVLRSHAAAESFTSTPFQNATRSLIFRARGDGLG